jgi:hypothetical protein
MYTVRVYLEGDSVPSQVVDVDTAGDAILLGRILVNQSFRATSDVTCDVVGPDHMLIACIDRTNNDTRTIVDNRRWLPLERGRPDRYPTLTAQGILEP